MQKTLRFLPMDFIVLRVNHDHKLCSLWRSIWKRAINSVYCRIFIWWTNKFIAFGPGDVCHKMLKKSLVWPNNPNLTLCAWTEHFSFPRTIGVYRFNVLNHFPVYKLLLLKIYFSTIMTFEMDRCSEKLGNKAISRKYWDTFARTRLFWFSVFRFALISIEMH